MKNWIFIFSVLCLAGCKGKETDSYLTPQKAQDYFRKITEICNRDNGRLWGRNLAGPVMFVDRKTRKISASQPDKQGLLKLQDGIYTGIYPKEKIINNIAVYYGGVLYSMTPLPEQEDEYRILSRAIHGLFHRYQQLTGINPDNFIAANMDDKDARLWIKFEWKALRKAIDSEGEERLRAIRDALIFRGSNRETYPEYANEEDRFEAYEGLATFTYMLFVTGSKEEFKKRLFDYLDRIYSLQSYSRSAGFVTGALYAVLLHDKGFEFSTIRTDNIDLGKLTKDLYQIDLPVVCRDVAGSISMNYDADAVCREEEKRVQDIKERITREASIFIEKPVVYLDLESPYFDFEPEDVHSLDTLGIIYNSIRVSDNWGKLSVDKGGCLVSNNFKYLRLPEKGIRKEKNHIYADGWNLILNDNWELSGVGENLYVRKQYP